ncbi:MAG TPA: tetratricopeptide repeat protein [Gemmatimonadales bacterium]|nr:tetratricopeptide repeat protein [Gemmatimonadales bacterium]
MTEPPARLANDDADVAGLARGARALADRGAWEVVCALLESEPRLTSGSGELGLLYGEALLRVGRTQEGHDALRRILPRLEEQGELAPRLKALNLFGASLLELGALDGAAATFQHVAELAMREHDDLLVAKARNNLAAIANIRGHHEEARGLYLLALAAYQRLGSPSGLAECHHNIAITFRDEGELERAEEHEQRAIEHAREAGSGRLAALALLGRAEIQLRRGDPAGAEAGAREAAAAFREAGDPICEGDALRLVGVACTAQANLVDARLALESALALLRGHDAALNEAETVRALAEWAAAAGDAAAAGAHGQAAANLFKRLGAAEEVVRLDSWLAALGTFSAPD